jgi:HSP20 family protein
VELKDLDLSIANNVLTIKGQKKDERESKDAKVYRQESWAGSFQRTLSLPNTVDPEKIEAVMKDGVLTVVLPKKEEVKPKQITVKIS